MVVTDLYIIAAGRGSRMNSELPKALVPITDEPCLTTTLQQIGHKFKNVFIVTNELVQYQWDIYFTKLWEKYPELYKNVVNIPITSGLGDGHATLMGLAGAQRIMHSRKNYCASEVVVVWGDVFFPQAEIIDELLSRPMIGAGLIPAVREDTPYVTLLVNNKMMCMSADFSKYGENHPTGFHDQSVFRFKLRELWNSLDSLHAAFWKNGRYITPGGELSLLYSFHHLANNESPAQIYETDFPTMSFNTAEEVAAIQTEIKEKWMHQFRNHS